MCEVVEARKKAENKGDNDIEDNECQFLARGFPSLPFVEEIKKHHSYNAERSPRGSGRCNTVGSKVPAHNEAKDTAADIDEEEPQGPNLLLHLPTQSQLEEHVESNVYDTGVQENWGDEAEPLVGLRLGIKSTANDWIWHGVEAA